eukprot:7868016-Lingulodinium_polyedra.AAC.1
MARSAKPLRPTLRATSSRCRTTLDCRRAADLICARARLEHYGLEEDAADDLGNVAPGGPDEEN